VVGFMASADLLGHENVCQDDPSNDSLTQSVKTFGKLHRMTQALTIAMARPSSSR
jgi:hypothetical protein